MRKKGSINNCLLTKTSITINSQIEITHNCITIFKNIDKHFEVIKLAFHEFIELDKNSTEALYIQIYDAIKLLIQNETLKPNSRLPAIRKLALKLSVNNVTIVNAYKMLEKNNFVYSRVGSGTFVRGKEVFENQNDNRNVSRRTKIIGEASKLDVDFASLTPDPKLFPVKEFKDAINEVLDRDGGYAFEYQEVKGYYPLRESLKKYILNRNVICDIDDIHIISGAQQGIDIVAKTLLNIDDTIVVESPTYTGALAAFRLRGANIVDVPIEEGGMNLEILEETLKKYSPKLIYVMTSFQNPTGISYSEEKKRGLLYLAKKYNTYILEDDYLPELSFSDEKSYPIKSMDKDSRVIYLKSFSKIFMPGIRLGFLAVPKTLSSNVVSAKHTSDISTSSLMQKTFDLYLRENRWQDYVENMRNIYIRKHKVVVDVIETIAPFIEFDDPKGGFHLYLKTDIDSLILSSIVRERKVSVVPGRTFYLDYRNDNYFRLSFAAVEDEKIEKGIEIIKNSYFDLKNLNSGNLFTYL